MKIRKTGLLSFATALIMVGTTIAAVPASAHGLTTSKGTPHRSYFCYQYPKSASCTKKTGGVARTNAGTSVNAGTQPVVSGVASMQTRSATQAVSTLPRTGGAPLSPDRGLLALLLAAMLTLLGFGLRKRAGSLV
jgi:hypothetical protein